ncbi:hypothetical protein [Tenacibaculum aquimarinum]|uniref:hypothetical protein n=1 Tax=Tenacibaculum aquimarinum TaxID=2910675 RepID=UPI001F0A3ACE|nr:hypothetical protein [Tenacibaculum aquimarinum]MCH3884741.1 hypothetical protein [Tenacibaculum aquimarinum]
MIFYGTKGSHLNSERKGGIKCDNCNEITNHNISVYGKYGYLYWIPVFPMGKKKYFPNAQTAKLPMTLKE